MNNYKKKALKYVLSYGGWMLFFASEYMVLFLFLFFFAYLSEKDLPHNGKLLVILSGRIKTLIL